MSDITARVKDLADRWERGEHLAIGRTLVRRAVADEIGRRVQLASEAWHSEQGQADEVR